MLFKRQPRAVIEVPEPPRSDASARRQGSTEALNLIARSIIEAVETAREEMAPETTDNFVAGQMMAFGQILASIERERDLLLQQLVQEAGLASQAEGPGWNAEMELMQKLALSSEDLFRLAMDFRKVEEPAEQIEIMLGDGPESEVKGPESEVKGPESGVKGPESAVPSSDSTIPALDPGVRTPDSPPSPPAPGDPGPVGE